MNLDLDIRMMATVREALFDKRNLIWKQRSSILKDKYKKNFGLLQEVYREFEDEKNPWTEHGRINIVLEKIRKINEKELAEMGII